MTYLDPVRDALAKKLPGIHPDLLDFYTLLAFVRGREVSREDVHDAWALWSRTYREDHPWMVPLAELPEDEQAKDELYVQAIRDVVNSLWGPAPSPDASR